MLCAGAGAPHQRDYPAHRRKRLTGRQSWPRSPSPSSLIPAWPALGMCTRDACAWPTSPWRSRRGQVPHTSARKFISAKGDGAWQGARAIKSPVPPNVVSIYKQSKQLWPVFTRMRRTGGHYHPGRCANARCAAVTSHTLGTPEWSQPSGHSRLQARSTCQKGTLQMSTRRATSSWTRAIQRQVGVITRRAVRTSSKMVKQTLQRSAKASKRRAAPKKLAGWHSGLALGPKGLRRYHLYQPPHVRATSTCALLVMLHGCAQDAQGVAASTRMNRLAASAGFMVVNPEQERLANLQACWNWFDTRSGRALAEAASIVAVIDQICATHPVEPRRRRRRIAGFRQIRHVSPSWRLEPHSSYSRPRRSAAGATLVGSLRWALGLTRSRHTHHLANLITSCGRIGLRVQRDLLRVQRPRRRV